MATETAEPISTIMTLFYVALVIILLCGLAALLGRK